MAQVRLVQWSTSAAVIDINLAITTALNKLRVFCTNNAAKYEGFTYAFGVDLVTGNFTFSAQAHVYSNAFPTLAAAISAAGGLNGNAYDTPSAL